jgi:hypothetical protein
MVYFNMLCISIVNKVHKHDCRLIGHIKSDGVFQNALYVHVEQVFEHDCKLIITIQLHWHIFFKDYNS